ncbi:hypothetical protein QJS10_CPA05g01518 [Acorus calamus]|uniref:Uncharacterized protein n=1 Tax=Acorus calamus TaxID=4465 RepID=A0AAV9EV49_ACOCL|nr:hypothetical protein QJS10_CPA05g01518 [Acorus calamus]
MLYVLDKKDGPAPSISLTTQITSEIVDVQNLQQDSHTHGVDELQVLDELYGEQEQRQLADSEKEDSEVNGDLEDWTDSEEEEDRSTDLCRPNKTYFDYASVDTYSTRSTDLCRPSEEDFD